MKARPVQFGVFLLVFCIFFFSPPPMVCAKKIKNILILHSYHQGFKWTDNISRGIESELADLGSDIELHYEYLDTKRSFGANYFEHIVAFKQYKTMLNKIKYAVIICADNNALKYVVEYGEKLYPDVPVVFCAINNFTPQLLKKRKKFTGVIETIDYKSNLDLVSRIHPKRTNIVVIIDRTPTGTAIKKEFQSVADVYKDKFTFEYYQDFLLEEVPGKISTLGKNDLIYILTFNRDRSGQFISYTDGIRMIRDASRVPIYGSWDFYFGNGIIGGLITSGHAQGQAAAKMAKKILSGISVEDIPVLNKSPNQYMFDYQQMSAFNIKIKQLPSDSYFINRPMGIFERYKQQIVGMLSVISFVVLLLLWRLFVQHRRQINLKKLNIELDKRVAEQTYKLEQKNEALTIEIDERIKLEKEIRKLAATDPLTGVNNRRSFIQKAAEEFSRSRRYHHPLSVLMMDIDHFKKINDTYGHHIGDISLKTFTNVCLETLRKQDFCGRLGGEEFAIILVETDQDKAFQVAERLRTLVDETIICEGSIQFSYQVSIGVTQLSDEDTQVEDTIQRADKGLYMAKNQGRNRVICI